MSQSAPHERVVSDESHSDLAHALFAAQEYHHRRQDWPDDDGPVTDLERWALRQMREVPHGQVTFFVQDSEIVRCEKRISEKP